jgi:glycosyltransferase involved in cell wall biosynthesis
MNKIPISVFIIAKNEEERIAKTINSVIAWVDEVIVIDSGSTDKTITIAKDLGCKTYFNKWQGYGQQKIFGEKKCKNTWLFNLDADEVVSSKLVQEIQTLFSKTPNQEAFRVKIKDVMPPYKKAHPLAFSCIQIRLYDKNKAGFKASSVHDSVVLKKPQPTALLKNYISHFSIKSIEHWLAKINSYSSMQAIDSYEKGKNVGTLKIIIAPIAAFLKSYFLRRFFIYGINGIVYSKIYAFSRFLKYAKIREIHSFKK